MRGAAQKPPRVARAQEIDDFLVWATLGVVLGGRTGYVLFYRPDFYFAHPAEIVEVWHGGMSFHGGALGVCAAILLFCRQRKLSVLGLADVIASPCRSDSFFGRIANFINGELWGRVTDVPWAMIFPNDPTQLPRHPSQLYEATMEGIILFAILYFLQRSRAVREHQGTLTGVFLIGYGIGAHHRRAVPPARRQSRLPLSRPDHGADPVASRWCCSGSCSWDTHGARSRSRAERAALGASARRDRAPRGRFRSRSYMAEALSIRAWGITRRAIPWARAAISSPRPRSARRSAN